MQTQNNREISYDAAGEVTSELLMSREGEEPTGGAG